MARPTIRFDGWVLDPESGDLERAGVRTRLQEQPVLLLQELIAHPGEVVTRERLIGVLWPKGVVDFDTGLNSAVRKLRSALGDTADTPRYIETLPRRGYRFIAALEQEPTSAVAPEPSSAPVPEPTPVSVPEPTSASVPQPELEQRLNKGPHETPNSAASELTIPGVPADRPSTGSARAPARWFLAVAAATVALVISGIWGVRFWAAGEHRVSTLFAPDVPKLSPEKSIAVLPFIDLSAAKDQEYFSDGLSEELIELLGRTPGLRVIARTSSFYFKGRQAKLEEIAQQLRVANILEGSVRKSGDRLRVTVQLVRADTGESTWSRTFDRDLHDVFQVQDEIANAVVAALRARLLPQHLSVAPDELRTRDLQAYTQYLRGRQSYNEGDTAGFRRAVADFRNAVALDSSYAAAYAALAIAEYWLADDVPAESAAGYERALAAAEKAVELAPEEAIGYSARGFLRTVYQFDFSGARLDLDRAVALSPGDANVLHRAAILSAVLGDLPQAVATERRAFALDPLSEEICRRLAFFLLGSQQLTEARPLLERALALAQNSARARFSLGELELLENRPAEALAQFRQTTLETLSLAGQAEAEYSLGHTQAADKVLAELIARYESTPWLIARVYAWRGDKARAFEWVERAYSERDSGVTWLKVDTPFQGLRTDSRYAALVRKMQLPQ